MAAQGIRVETVGDMLDHGFKSGGWHNSAEHIRTVSLQCAEMRPRVSRIPATDIETRRLWSNWIPTHRARRHLISP